MSVIDLREWIDRVSEMGQLKKVEGAEWDLEIGTITELYQKKEEGPALLFDKIPGYPEGYRVLTNVNCSIERIALTLNIPGAKKAIDIVQAWRNTSKDLQLISPKLVDKGPILENVCTGDDINLWKFPVPRWHEDDGGRYIGTGCSVIMKDPESDWVNSGTYRVMAVSEDQAAIMISPGKHGGVIMEKYWSQGKPCPIAVVVGQEPLMYTVSSMEIPSGVSEFEYAGALRKSPLEILNAPYTGLPIPAAAEIVFEGEIWPGDVTDEGPFGEWTGYYAGGKHKAPVIRVKTVLHRNDPIILGACPSIPPSEQTYYRAPLRAAIIWDQLEAAGVPGIKNVYLHQAGGARMLVIVAVEQKYAGHARQAGIIASQCHGGAYVNRWVIVVDHDVDITDTNEVLWAALTRCDPGTDLEILKRGWSSRLDPLSYSGTFNNRMVIDACIPWERKDNFPKMVKARPETVHLVKSKFSELF